MNSLNGDDIGNLLYLGLLGAAVAFWFFTSARQGMNKMLQQMALWALIFVGVIAAYGMWSDIRSAALPNYATLQDGTHFELPRNRDGHYYATALVNGTSILFVIDTGASGVVLTKADAAKAGIDADRLAYLNTAMTANGAVRIAQTNARTFGLPGHELQNFRLMVNEGDMRQSLMGMSYLQHFSRLEISGGKMVLEP